jgi:hypothetical protein
VSAGPIVIVHGPIASGKSSNARRLLQHFQCTRLVDCWDGRKKLQPGDLALTNMEPPYSVTAAPIGTQMIGIAEALMRLGRRLRS